MVKRVGAARRSLRRRIAGATPVTPKAECSWEAFGDHQRNSLLGAAVLAGFGRAALAASRGETRLGAHAK